MEKDQHNDPTTSTLLDVLQSADIRDIPQYSRTYLQGRELSFASYMDELIATKGLKRQDIFQRADLPQKYGYKLLTVESHTRDRDKLLRLFFAMGLTYAQVRRALALYGMPGLYPKRKRDAILIIAFNRGDISVDEVNQLLTENGEAQLSRSRD